MIPLLCPKCVMAAIIVNENRKPIHYHCTTCGYQWDKKEDW